MTEEDKHQKSSIRRRAMRLTPDLRGPQGGKSYAERKVAKEVSRYLRKYGVTPAQRDAIAWAQGNCCGICLRPLSLQTGVGADRARLDHDHETGEIRGVLCHQCNVGLGNFQDDPELLTKAQAYLLKYRRRG